MSTSLMTIPEAADALRVKPRTIRRYVDRGDLAAVRLGPRRGSPIRIPSASIANFLRDTHSRERAVIA